MAIYPDDEDLTFEMSNITFSDVKLEVKGAAMTAYAKKINVDASAKDNTFDVDDAKYTSATQGTCTWTITGATAADGKALKGTGISALETLIKTTGIKVLGNQAVVITVTGLDLEPVKYTAGELTATALTGFGLTGSETITVTATPNTAVTPGSNVEYTVKLSAAPACKAVRVQIADLGIDTVLKDATAYKKTIVLNKDITLTANDGTAASTGNVKVTAVPAPKITNVSWTGTQIVVTFDKAITYTANGIAKKAFADSSATVTESWNTEKTVLTLTVMGGVLKADDTLSITPASIKDAYGIEFATETDGAHVDNTITLKADGTGVASHV